MLSHDFVSVKHFGVMNHPPRMRLWRPCSLSSQAQNGKLRLRLPRGTRRPCLIVLLWSYTLGGQSERTWWLQWSSAGVISCSSC